MVGRPRRVFVARTLSWGLYVLSVTYRHSPHATLQVLEDHVRPVLSLAVADGKLFSGSYDYTIKVRQSPILASTHP